MKKNVKLCIWSKAKIRLLVFLDISRLTRVSVSEKATFCTKMDELFRNTRRLIFESRNLLETLESASTNTHLDPMASSAVAESFRDNLVKLSTNGADLRRQVSGEPPSRRQVWKARLRDLDDQIAELRAGESRCANRFRKIAREKQMREELFQRRHGTTNIIIGGMDGSASGGTFRAGEEARRLDQSGSVVGNILNSGRDTLQSLTNQRDRLHGARKKMLDVLHQIGVDRHIIARIERRERSDMILAYGLMAAMLVLLGLAVLWKYHRRRQ